MEMTPWERRQKVLELLCLRRQETSKRLSDEFHVSRETIRHDIMVLSCSYPIEITSGRYGSIKVADWFHLDSRTLNANQVTFLRRLSARLDKDDREMLERIIVQFSH